MPHSICLEISQTDNFTEQHALKGKKLQAARPERKKLQAARPERKKLQAARPERAEAPSPG